MTRTAPIRFRPARLVGLLVVVAVAVAAAHAWPAPSDFTSTSPAALPRLGERHATGGAIPDGTTVFDGQVAGVANLDGDLLAALRQASSDSGVTFLVDSGWRSRSYQAQLFRDAVTQYGSAAEAARWVARPSTSEHVSGHAVDLGPDAAAWLSAHGAAYGLCQIYANESWHYELRPDAVQRGCPAMYADPTHDPRMHP